MKKRRIIEIITYIITLPLFGLILYLFRNKESLEWVYYLSAVVYVGMVVPLIRIVFLLINEAKEKEIVYSNYEAPKYFVMMIAEGVLYYLVNHLLKNSFDSIHILLWILLPLIIIIVYVVFYFISRKQEAKNGPKVIKNVR